MVGYHGRPEEITAERQAGGWHHTNDLGRRESDGSISFVGPKSRLIKSAAENIYPAEVEAALQSHPAVAERRGDRRARPDVGPERAGDRVVAEGQHVHRRRAHRALPGSIAILQEAAIGGVRRRRCPANGWPIDYDALDDRFGGGGYPGRW